MSDTYNPNEIAKVKHLDELARQLATWETKINLDTDESCSVEFDIFIPEDDTYAELNWHVTINVTKE